MTPLVLPTPESNPGKAEWSEVYANDKALKDAHETLEAEFKASTRPVTWYAPKVIATEQTRESTAYGTLTTADEITNVVLPENGLIVIGYAALAKNSVASAGLAGIFIGANQLKTAAGVGAAPSTQATKVGSDTAFHFISTGWSGLANSANESTSTVTTGQLVDSGEVGGVCYVFAAAGTYNVSVRYKATSGSVTAKDRKLWVYTLGT